MPEFDSDMRFDSQPQPTEPFDGILTDDQDLLMEQILENINTTPIGQVLKKIAMLPEVRKEKKNSRYTKPDHRWKIRPQRSAGPGTRQGPRRADRLSDSSLH
jgi:hypothetical protein